MVRLFLFVDSVTRRFESRIKKKQKEKEFQRRPLIMQPLTRGENFFSPRRQLDEGGKKKLWWYYHLLYVNSNAKKIKLKKKRQSPGERITCSTLDTFLFLFYFWSNTKSRWLNTETRQSKEKNKVGRKRKVFNHHVTQFVSYFPFWISSSVISSHAKSDGDAG